MLQESTHYEGKGSQKALMFLSLLLGFGLVTLLSLPHAYNADEPSTTMASAPTKIMQPMQPVKAWPSLRALQSSRAGQFMQPVRQPVSAWADKLDHSTHPSTNVESHLQASSVLGRRDAIAAAFASAAAATSNRAAVAKESAADVRANEKVYGNPATSSRIEPPLPPAGDYTSYNKVITVPRPEKDESSRTPGTVEIQPALIPAVAVISALVTAAVPGLLSPGETAFQAQRTRSGKGAKLGAVSGPRPGTRQQPRKSTRGTAAAKTKSGFFR